MKYLDSDGLLYVINKIKAWLNGKVDKVEGKGLSTHDLTDELLEKLMNAGDSSFSGNYNELINKPKINGHELKETNSLADLGIQPAGNYQAAGDYATNTALTTGLSGKVDKVSGKGLSTNDYTTTEKNKLGNIAAGAQVNVIEVIEVNGAAQEIADKTVDIFVPTKTSDLTNDSDFATNATVTTKVNGVDTKVSNLGTTVEGLSTKLNTVEQNAEVNIIESVKVNGEALTVTDKAVNIVVPTKVSSLTNDSNYATTAGVSTSITNALKNYDTTATINEKLGDYVTTTEHSTDLGGKVDKVSGKGLSTNDYTTTEKTKLSGIAGGAQVNVLEGVKVNGTTLTPTNKIVDVTVPTKVSALDNDSGFQTATQVTTAINSAVANKVEMSAVNSAISTATNDMATKTYVVNQLANINKKTVVTAVSQMVDTSTIYLMANDKGTNDEYDEYIVLEGGQVEKIGTTKVDLTNYVQESELSAITNAEIDQICA